MIFLIFFAYFSKKNKNFVSFSQKLNFFRKIQIKKYLFPYGILIKNH